MPWCLLLEKLVLSRSTSPAAHALLHHCRPPTLCFAAAGRARSAASPPAAHALLRHRSPAALYFVGAGHAQSAPTLCCAAEAAMNRHPCYKRPANDRHRYCMQAPTAELRRRSSPATARSDAGAKLVKAIGIGINGGVQQRQSDGCLRHRRMPGVHRSP